MADIVVPEDLLLPLPTTENEKDLYNTLQDYTKKVGQSFSALEDIEAITAGTGITDTDNVFSVNDSDVDHDSLDNTHNLTTDIDHDTITNNHNLTTDIDHDTITNNHDLTSDIDHDQLANFTQTEHFTMLDQDDMSGDSATQAATQQSIKKFVEDSLSDVATAVYSAGTTYTYASADTERITESTIYVKLKEIQVAFGGVVTITQRLEGSAASAYSKIYLNGVAVAGTEHSTQAAANYSDNVTVEPGDLVQLYCLMTAGGGYYARPSNFRIKGAGPETTTVITD